MNRAPLPSRAQLGRSRATSAGASASSQSHSSQSSPSPFPSALFSLAQSPCHTHTHPACCQRSSLHLLNTKQVCNNSKGQLQISCVEMTTVGLNSLVSGPHCKPKDWPANPLTVGKALSFLFSLVSQIIEQCFNKSIGGRIASLARGCKGHSLEVSYSSSHQEESLFLNIHATLFSKQKTSCQAL